MFELKQKDGSDSYHFVLKAGNGQVILSSQVYKSKSGAANGIESVKKNCSDDDCWERKTAKNGKAYFNLKSTNGQIIGTSQMYSSSSAMEIGIKSVKKNSPDAEVVEQFKTKD